MSNFMGLLSNDSFEAVTPKVVIDKLWKKESIGMVFKVLNGILRK